MAEEKIDLLVETMKSIAATAKLVVVRMAEVHDKKEKGYLIHVTPVTSDGVIRFDSLIFQDFKKYDTKEEAGAGL